MYKYVIAFGIFLILAGFLRDNVSAQDRDNYRIDRIEQLVSRCMDESFQYNKEACEKLREIDLVIKEEEENKNPVFSVKVTSYNPEVGQTDSTPCIAGGTGYNVCDMAKSGKRPLALSQELIDWSVSVWSIPESLSAGDLVIMKTKEGTLGHGDPRCNGEFTISDAMNVRYRNRADIFFLHRADNISCEATIQKIRN